MLASKQGIPDIYLGLSYYKNSIEYVCWDSKWLRWKNLMPNKDTKKVLCSWLTVSRNWTDIRATSSNQENQVDIKCTNRISHRFSEKVNISLEGKVVLFYQINLTRQRILK